MILVTGGAAPRDAAELAAGQFAARCSDCGGELDPVAIEEDATLDPRNVYAATRSVGEMACALSAAAGPGAPAPIVTGDFSLGDVRHVFASAELAERKLGFRSREVFAAGMADFATAPLRAA